VTRRTRYLIGIALYVVSWVLFGIAGYVGDTADRWLLAGTVAATLLGVVAFLNPGFRPRVSDDRMLVSTLFGRQSVDLSALVRIHFFASLDHRRANVRLTDAGNGFTVALPRLEAFRDPLRTAFAAADDRGVAVPRSARTVLDLEADDSAPRWGYRTMLRELVPAVIVWPAGMLVVILIWRLT
jgi:hypothetical protein